MSRGLFSRLIALHGSPVPAENFFTELIAYLLESSPEVVRRWALLELGFEIGEEAEVSVSTQVEYDPLATDLSGNRPDIVIEAQSADGRQVVFLESKLESAEGEGQLCRYAGVLSRLPGVTDRALVYITKFHDPRHAEEVLRHVAPGVPVRFHQRRWSDFYRFLKAAPDYPLRQEVLTYMEEHAMSQSNLFAPMDVLALSSLSSAMDLMDATLWEDAADEFSSVLGVKPKGLAHAYADLRRFGRYLVHYYSGDWLCAFGYWLRTSSPGDYPNLGVMLQMSPKVERTPALMDHLREVSSRPGWSSFNLEKGKAWAGVWHRTSLRDFLAQPDHVDAVRKHFLELSQEVMDIRGRYADVMPGATGEVVAGDGDDPQLDDERLLAGPAQ